MSKARLLAAFLAAGWGCSTSSPPATVDDLVAESRRFRGILEPSLREAAESYLADFRLKGVRHRGTVAVECRPMGGMGATYVSPDGKDKRSVTEDHHVARIAETSMEYRLVDIPSLSHSGSDQFPFEGIAAVEVTTVIRSVGSVFYQTADVPAGYRKTESEGGGGGTLRTPKWRAAPPGLPVVLDSEAIPADLPAEAKTAINDAVRRCLQAPPRIERVLYRVKFRYDAAARRWMQAEVPVRE